MKPGTLIASLAVLVILSGCAAAPRHGRPPQQYGVCNEHVCHITISVDDACHITANPETLEVKETGVELHWDIVSRGYVFDGSGITIEHDDRGEFANGHIAEQGSKYVLNDKNSFTRPYKYDVHVKSGDKVCSLDPWIFNN
ncbi:MAG TPA: hypothetical protein VF428_00805 [Casimicrobiaceae bacterium]